MLEILQVTLGGTHHKRQAAEGSARFCAQWCYRTKGGACMERAGRLFFLGLGAKETASKSSSKRLGAPLQPPAENLHTGLFWESKLASLGCAKQGL